MTETTSAGTASNHTLVKTLINVDEEVEVCGEVKRDMYLKELVMVNEAAFKCAQCKHLTIHEGIEIRIGDLFVDEGKTIRYYLCTNCGTFRFKA